MSQNVKGTAIGLAAIGMWSVTVVFIAYITTVPPLELAALVFFVGYLSLTVIQMVRGENILSYWRQPLSSYAFWLGTAGLYTIMIFISFRTVPVFEANILNYLWPILLIVFAAWLNAERVTAIKIIGGIIGFAGAVTVFLPSGGVPAFAGFHWGHGLSLVSAVIWALYSAMAKNRHYPSGFFGPVFFVFCMICFILHVIFETTIWPQPSEWVIIFFLGFFRLSYAMWDYGMKHGDVILLASCSYFLPLISSVILITLGFGPQNPMIALGAAMIITGCLVVNYDRILLLFRRKKATVP